MTEQINLTHYRAPDGTAYRLYLEPDPDASSPRGEDWNLATLVTWDSRYTSPDNDLTFSEAENLLDSPYFGSDNGVRRCHLYVKAYRPDILAAVPLVRSGYDGNLATDPHATGRAVGIAYVTRADWDRLMNPTTPLDGSTGSPTPLEAIEQEVANYNAWASGEYVGFIVEQRRDWTKTYADGSTLTGWDWEDVQSVWGIDDDEYAMDEARSFLPAGSVTITRDEAEQDTDEDES